MLITNVMPKCPHVVGCLLEGLAPRPPGFPGCTLRTSTHCNMPPKPQKSEYIETVCPPYLLWTAINIDQGYRQQSLSQVHHPRHPKHHSRRQVCHPSRLLHTGRPQAHFSDTRHPERPSNQQCRGSNWSVLFPCAKQRSQAAMEAP